MERERLGSRIGFILLSAGCAIGIGNVWKFPYITGQYGGGIFVLIYLLFLVIFGIPVMTMEFAIGRASQKSPAKMYEPLAPKGSPFHLHGWACVIGCYLLMMFYSSVSGWMLQYFVNTATGKLEGLDSAAIGAAFGDMLSDPVSMTVYMAIMVIAGFAINSIGLQKGLERVTKWMMLALLLLMGILAVNSITLEGGAEGLSFYLKPDLNKLLDAGVFNVIVAAMNQAFFTLSLGIGSMAIFGSYLKKDRALMGESINVAVLDTCVALCSGLIIFPACSAYGVAADSGPNLLFITLPNIFNNLPMGQFWGSLFFLFMTFAAFSTVLAVFESIIACTCDLTGWSRKKSCLVNCIAMLILSMPCILGFNVWAEIQPLKAGKNIMDLEDFIVSNCLLPLGSLTMVLFCTRKFGWGWDSFVAEANTGKGAKVQNWMRFYMTWVLPIIVITLFVAGLISFFK
ncbi:MAG: sodium-dependent transporter [Oscillospiraceae bacterium]|nr:sodium-dependent transporter [Oscillospiraceae bacterium]